LEFRIIFNKLAVRLLAFWDKTDKKRTLVLATNGFCKKTKKTPANEIKSAKRIMKRYFIEKTNK
jgi:phage-related protein